jgi:hypothetical protein
MPSVLMEKNVGKEKQTIEASLTTKTNDRGQVTRSRRPGRGASVGRGNGSWRAVEMQGAGVGLGLAASGCSSRSAGRIKVVRARWLASRGSRGEG